MFGKVIVSVHHHFYFRRPKKVPIAIESTLGADIQNAFYTANKNKNGPKTLKVIDCLKCYHIVVIIYNYYAFPGRLMQLAEC